MDANHKSSAKHPGNHVVKRDASTGQFVPKKQASKATKVSAFGVMRGTMTIKGDVVSSPYDKRKK